MKLDINITIVITTSILCITGIMIFALSKGLDGVLTTGSLALLAGIPAWFVTKKLSKRNGKG